MNTSTPLLTKFDAKNKVHVEWLRDLHFCVKDDPKNAIASMVNNPLGVKVDPRECVVDWIHWHFALSLKYTGAVFERRAYVPDYNIDM